MTNLLLLLSAMLSALVGAGPAGRVREAPVAVAATHVQVAPTAVRAVAVRPAFALPRLVTLIGAGIVVLLLVPVAAPAWKSRRRE